MSYSEFVRRTVTALALFFVVIVIGLTVSRLLSILLIVFTCWVLSVGLNAAIRRLERYGMSRVGASIIVFLLIVLILFLIIAIVVPPFVVQIGDLISELPGALESIVSRYEEFWQNNETVQNFLPEFTLQDYQEIIGTSVEEVVGEVEDTGSGGAAIDITRIANSALPILGGIGSFVGSLIANLIFILLITAYLVADPLAYYRPFVALVPKSSEGRIVELINEIQRNVIAWMGSLSISIAFTTVTVTLFLGVILQIPNSVAMGVISGLGALIPNIGYYIGLIPIFIFTLADDPIKVIPAVAIYWLLNQFEGAVLMPNVMKAELNIPAGVILPFQLMAAALFGFFGILLAVPILSILITIVRELYVYDELGKRGDIGKLAEDDYGRVYLVDQEAEAPTS